MTQLSPEQWRALDYLYQHKLHTVRPRLTHVRKSQKVSDDDLLDLIRRGLVIPLLGDDEIPERAGHLPRIMQSAVVSVVRLRLTASGLRIVLGDPGNQIRYTLGQHDKPIRLAKLFEGNDITPDDLTSQHRSGLISITLAEFGEIDPPTASELAGRAVVAHMYVDYLFGDIVKVEVTTKGREYLPL